MDVPLQSKGTIGLTDRSDSEMVRAIIAPYLKYARLRYRTTLNGIEKESWRFILASLQKRSYEQYDPQYLSVQRLITLLRDHGPANQFGIVRYFKELCSPSKWRLEVMAREYFNE